MKRKSIEKLTKRVWERVWAKCGAPGCKPGCANCDGPEERARQAKLAAARVPARRALAQMNIETPTTTWTGEDGFRRTALDVSRAEHGSLDVIIRGAGGARRLCQINITVGHGPDLQLIVDVIDIDDVYSERSAFVFSGPTSRRGIARKELKAPKGGKLVSVDFRSPPGRKKG